MNLLVDVVLEQNSNGFMLNIISKNLIPNMI